MMVSKPSGPVVFLACGYIITSAHARGLIDEYSDRIFSETTAKIQSKVRELLPSLLRKRASAYFTSMRGCDSEAAKPC